MSTKIGVGLSQQEADHTRYLREAAFVRFAIPPARATIRAVKPKSLWSNVDMLLLTWWSVCS